jgi:hypothetical protein
LELKKIIMQGGETMLYRKQCLTLWLVIACVGILFTRTDAYAQRQRGPCADDIARFCKDVKPGGGRLVKCIEEHEKELSPVCAESLRKATEKPKGVQALPRAGQNFPGAARNEISTNANAQGQRGPCADDIARFCKDVKPGEGRLVKCIEEHEKELSPACAESLRKTTEKPKVAQATPKVGLNFPVAFKNDIGAKLQICNIGQSCSGDMGSMHWMKEATINADDKLRALTWETHSKEITGGLLQISLIPFNDSWPADTIFSQNVSPGNFVFDFKILFASQKAVKPGIRLLGVKSAPASPEPATQPMKRAEVNAAAMTSDLVYHVRVVPMNGTKIAGMPSNEVAVKIVPVAQGMRLYVPPKIYTVKIKEFKPLLAPDKGVCPHAMILDTGGLVPRTDGMGFEAKKAGDRICPKPFMGMGEKSWYESLWNEMTGGLSWVSKAYNTLKSSVVNVVGNIACSGDSICVNGLSAGLDIGLTALGIPPTIPNFDELMDGGFDYIAGELSSQAGCPDVACKDLIKKGLKTALDQNKNTNPGCTDAGAAHAMGIEPLCLPSGVKAHWDPAATYRDAKVVLEVTRNFVDIPNEDKAASSHRVLLSVWATNSQPVGGMITNIEPYDKSMKITKPLDAELFSYRVIPIPRLEKGQKIDIPINMTAEEYWVPGHKELMGGWTTVTYKDGWPQYQYDDWWLLYYGAQATISVNIDGCLYGGIDCISSSDTKSMTLPMTLNLY